MADTNLSLYVAGVAAGIEFLVGGKNLGSSAVIGVGAAVGANIGQMNMFGDSATPNFGSKNRLMRLGLTMLGAAAADTFVNRAPIDMMLLIPAASGAAGLVAYNMIVWGGGNYI